MHFEKTHHGDGGQQKAQHLGPYISHEYFCRILIVGPEAYAGTDHAQKKDGDVDVDVFHNKGYDKQRCGADGGHTYRQPIQPVNQVNGIGAAHNPDNSNQDGDRLVEIDHFLICHEIRDTIYNHTAGNTNNRRSNLDAEFNPGAEIINIVKPAHNGDDDTADQNPLYLVCQIHKQNGGNHKTAEYCDSAHSWDWNLVDAPGIGHVNGTDALSKTLDRRHHKI